MQRKFFILISPLSWPSFTTYKSVKSSQLLRKEILLSLSCISNHNFLPFLQTNTWSMGGLLSTQRCQLIVYQGRARLWVSIYNAHQRLTNLLHPPCRHHHHHKGWVVTKQYCWQRFLIISFERHFTETILLTPVFMIKGVKPMNEFSLFFGLFLENVIFSVSP